MEENQEKVQYENEHITAYTIIAINNFLISPNRIDLSLKTAKMFVESLHRIHKKENVIDFANMLLEKESIEKKWEYEPIKYDK